MTNQRAKLIGSVPDELDKPMVVHVIPEHGGGLFNDDLMVGEW